MDALADMLGLYHPGEDWNKGSGDFECTPANSTPVYAAAYGVVIEVSQDCDWGLQ